MEDNLHISHDKLFRETWSNLPNAKSFLRNYLPRKILEMARLETLEICKDSFIEKELKDYYTDMLYKVKLGEEPGYLYFLFEHKSHPEKWIHIQLLQYMLKIWQLDLKQAKVKKLPIVIPLVLYHGRNKWRIDQNFSSVFRGPVTDLTEYIPDYKYILYDLSRYSDREIKGTIMARVAMLLLKYVFDPNFTEKLPEIFALLEDLSGQETGLQYFESLVKYVFNYSEDITQERFQSIVPKALLEEKGDIIMTLAEKLRDEGIQIGRGLEIFEGIEIAVSGKFGETNESQLALSKIKNIKDLNKLKALKDKIKSAKSILELMNSI